MRLRSFSEMLIDYGINELEPDDQVFRTEMVSKLPYSFVVEEGHIELENLKRWIKSNIGEDKAIYLYYGKTGYDFGIAEYFFEEELNCSKTAEAVPRLYTLYPHSLAPNKGIKSDGYEKYIPQDPEDKDAIVFEPPKEV